MGRRKASVQRRPRGPSLAKTTATRQALVHAALSTFLERGFAETRMEDVAARAGVAKGTTYRYFVDKRAIFAEVMREVVRSASEGRPIGRPRPAEPTRDFLRRTFIPILRELQAGDRFGVLSLVMAEGPRLPEFAAIYREVAVMPVLRLAKVYAARAKRRGELRSDAVSHQPMLLVAPAILAALWNNVFAQGKPLDVAAVFDAYLDLLFGP